MYILIYRVDAVSKSLPLWGRCLRGRRPGEASSRRMRSPHITLRAYAETSVVRATRSGSFRIPLKRGHADLAVQRCRAQVDAGIRRVGQQLHGVVHGFGDAVLGNHAEAPVEFLREGDRLTFDPEGSITSRRLCLLYRKWCEDNGLKPLYDAALISYLKENARKYGVEYSRCIPEDGNKLRGFRGMRMI